MPQKNASKEYIADSYYHVFNRAVAGQKLFVEAADYRKFLSLMDRYLLSGEKFSSVGEKYPNYHDVIKINAYCLMGNHIHIMLHQTEPDAIKLFMSSVMTSYSKYFNCKYKRSGTLFESRYKAKRIDDDSYLLHISRYIHMNPRYWPGYRYSSYKYMFAGQKPDWLDTAVVVDEFKTAEAYEQFLYSYEDRKNELAELKYQLADS